MGDLLFSIGWDFILVPPRKLVKGVWLIFLMQYSLCALDSKAFASFLPYISFFLFPIKSFYPAQYCCQEYSQNRGLST